MVTEPDGMSVLPVPTFLLANACVKFAVSPAASAPEVIVGTPVELVVPLYTLVSVTAVTVIAIGALNVAVTLRSSLIETMQDPVPEHAPDHPANTAPASAVAVSVTFRAGVVTV